MTIDEAIKYCEEIAEEFEEWSEWEKDTITGCKECAEEHRQLAEWLRELKKYRAIFKKVGKILADNGYTIDDLDTIFEKVTREVNADEDSD